MKNKYDLHIKNTFDLKISQVMKDMESMFDDIKSDILKIADEKLSHACKTQIVNTEKTTYADITGSKSMVVIKPIDVEQTNDKTKCDIMKNINPVDYGVQVSQVKRVRDGGILIGCNNTEGATSFAKIAKEKLSSSYKVSEVRKNLPKIKVVGLVENYTGEDLVKYLKGQNDVISDDCHVSVLRVWGTKKDSNIFQALVELDASAYGLVLNRGKLFVNYDIDKFEVLANTPVYRLLIVGIEVFGGYEKV
ncbi:unnamed protein product [Phaedon cochleariae]|uniref:Uncharacterized protein n=1 Tax=Phaedon cochleariae TaxID=80249 RepID=A0A9N9SHX8_PHACE|nr:unnamed protein product [Phaedon cochleariae]